LCASGTIPWQLRAQRELCPFDLAPVTSTAIQMLFGDTVAIALMQARASTALTVESTLCPHT
jgi:arabinose-5-phosphate isomerase